MRHIYNNYSKILNITGYLLARLQSHLHLKILFMILRLYCFHFDECIKKAQVIFKWGTKGNRGGEREGEGESYEQLLLDNCQTEVSGTLLHAK